MFMFLLGCQAPLLPSDVPCVEDSACFCWLAKPPCFLGKCLVWNTIWWPGALVHAGLGGHGPLVHVVAASPGPPAFWMNFMYGEDMLRPLVARSSCSCFSGLRSPPASLINLLYGRDILRPLVGRGPFHVFAALSGAPASWRKFWYARQTLAPLVARGPRPCLCCQATPACPG